MHVVMFGDQHLQSQGGAQVSMRLQRRFLERAGHTVTVVQPAMPGRRAAGSGGGAADVDLPSIPLTPDREYAMVIPGRRADRRIDRALADRPPVDLVHVQGDFWGGFLGHRYARRHDLPLVHTLHNRVAAGIRAVSPLPGTTLRALNLWQRRALPARGALPAGTARGHDGWAYLTGLVAGSDAVTAPSSHWAARLERHGVFPAVDVVWNGIDDDVLDRVPVGARREGPPRIVWLGRMSPEKRLLPFLDAVARSEIDAEVTIVGGGAQRRAAERLVAERRPRARVRFAGRLGYEEVLATIADADAVALTSTGFETQGMTVFEAASLGTRALLVDPDIAAELGTGRWLAERPDALAATLRTAARDIRSGDLPPIDPGIRERFRQSSRTAAMVAVYERVLAERGRVRGT